MKFYSFAKWFSLYVIRPCATVWIVVNGVPPTVRAVCNGVCAVVRAFR